MEPTSAFTEPIFLKRPQAPSISLSLSQYNLVLVLLGIQQQSLSFLKTLFLMLNFTKHIIGLGHDELFANQHLISDLFLEVNVVMHSDGVGSYFGHEIALSHIF